MKKRTLLSMAMVATMMVATNSVTLKELQKIMGHSKIQTTMDIYAKVKYNKPEEVVKALEGAFAMWEGQSGTK